MTVIGQYLMCVSRRALSLSNYEVLTKLASTKVSNGVYRYLSHPMYVGLVLALCGSALVLGNRAALGVLLLLIPLLALRAYAESRG